MSDTTGVAGLILAAGTGSRFGGHKMAACLGGRPLPAHVLAAARAAGLRRFVLVLGRDAVDVRAGILEADPTAMDGVLVVVNGAPERGLATSVRLGMAAATAAPRPEGVLVLLGDQPLVRPEVIGALVAADAPPGALAVVPEYAGDGAPNPVLLLPAADRLIDALSDDRGFGALLAANRERVVRVPVAGANPDVDTLVDLAVLEGRTRA